MPKNPVITLVDDNGQVIKSTANGDGTASFTAAAAATTVITYASAAQTASNPGVSFSTANLTSLAVDTTVAAFTGGTSPTVTFFVDRLGSDGVWYRLWTSAAIAAPAATSTNIGPGTGTGNIPAVLSGTARFGWTLGGSPTSVTLSASVIGR